MKKNHKLGELVVSIQEHNDWSDLRPPAARRDAGPTARSKSNSSRWRTAPVNAVKCGNIRDVAKVLSVPEAAVASVALESIGVSMELTGNSSLDQAISVDVELSTRDKTIVRVVLEATRQTDELSGSGKAAAIAQAGRAPQPDESATSAPTTPRRPTSRCALQMASNNSATTSWPGAAASALAGRVCHLEVVTTARVPGRKRFRCRTRN